MTDATIINYLNTEGPFETVGFLADMLTVEAEKSPIVANVKAKLRLAVESEEPANLRMALNAALRHPTLGTGVWRGWCLDVLRWMANPVGSPLQGESSEGVVNLPAS